MARIKRRLRRSKPKMKRKITTCSSCSKRATSSKPKVERGQLTYLLTNPGLDHIPRQVLSYLDAPTIVSCLRVSKAFKAMIENERHWYLLQSKLLRKYRTPNMIMTASATGQLRQLWTKTALLFNRRLVPPKYPQWVKAFEFYENEANFEELQGFVWFIKDYTLIDDEDDESSRYSPLFHAARFGNLKVLQFCLDNEFCFDHEAFKPSTSHYNNPYSIQGQEQLQDNHKNRLSPLSMACKHAQTEAVKLILSYSETKEIALGRFDDTRKTAFHWACLNGCLDIVKLLLRHMKDPKKTELTPIQFERRTNEKEYRKRFPNADNLFMFPEIFDSMFADTFVEPNKPDNVRMTGFHYACREGHTEIVEYLVEKADDLGLDIQAVDVFKRTGLHWACKVGKIDVVKLLLNSKNVDLNARNHCGATPFMIACEEDWIDIVKEFFQHSNIDFNARDKLGRTAFFKACEKGHYQIVILMYEQSGRPFRLQIGLNPEEQELREEKIDIFASDDEGINALHVAKENKDERIMELLNCHYEYMRS